MNSRITSFSDAFPIELLPNVDKFLTSQNDKQNFAHLARFKTKHGHILSPINPFKHLVQDYQKVPLYDIMKRLSNLLKLGSNDARLESHALVHLLMSLPTRPKINDPSLLNNAVKYGHSLYVIEYLLNHVSDHGIRTIKTHPITLTLAAQRNNTAIISELVHKFPFLVTTQTEDSNDNIFVISAKRNNLKALQIYDRFVSKENLIAQKLNVLKNLSASLPFFKDRPNAQIFKYLLENVPSQRSGYFIYF